VQVLSNLLWNAARYTPAQGRIELTAEPHDGRVAIRVRDNGFGIDPEALDSIFEMFRQGERPGNGGSSGLGIGLTLVKSLVEMHGGTIAVQSEGPGKGSEFCVELPLSELPPPATRTKAPAPPSHLQAPRRHKILVVDDNTPALATLQKSIELIGHEVRAASNGREALRVAEEFRPELIFLDIAMPGLDGYETARQIRARPWGGDVVLVALTGYGQGGDKERACAAGFDHHLTKPGETAAVLRVIDELDGSPAK
jgi:two-component system CheB/CheR fusion protein